MAIILNTNGQTANIYGGRYFIRTLLNGGTATVKLNLLGGDSSFADFDDNALSEGIKLIDLPGGQIELTATGSPTVELVRVDW